jgi:hypothetical protein
VIKRFFPLERIGDKSSIDRSIGHTISSRVFLVRPIKKTAKSVSVGVAKSTRREKDNDSGETALRYVVECGASRVPGGNLKQRMWRSSWQGDGVRTGGGGVTFA